MQKPDTGNSVIPYNCSNSSACSEIDSGASKLKKKKEYNNLKVCQAVKGSIFWHTNPVTNQFSNKQSAVC